MNSNGFFFTKLHNKYVRVFVDEILYIEGSRNYCKIVTSANSFTVHNTLKQLQKTFGDDQFIRSHKSFLVNLSQVKSFDRISIHFASKVVPLSTNFRNDFENRLQII